MAGLFRTADCSIIVECAGADGLDAFVRWLRADAGFARTGTTLLSGVVSGRPAAGSTGAFDLLHHRP